MLAVLMTGGIADSEAGQARAQFKASLRIDADLIARDRTTVGTATVASTTVETSATADNAISRLSATPDTITSALPRADGSGYCVRVNLNQDRWRWQCN